MTHTAYELEQLASKGKLIYEKELKSLLEPNFSGKYVVIDTTTGEYEVDENDVVASKRAAAKCSRC